MKIEITKGKLKTSVKTIIYGPEGIGKSTLASMFPEPLFIDTEGSTSHMDVSRLPNPATWNTFAEEIKWIQDNPDSCKTLVIDTIDWAERLCMDYVCRKHNVSGIEEIGYGKGYTYMSEEFGRMLDRLNVIADSGINIVLTAHAQITKFEQPDEMGSYDRWELKLSKKCRPLVKEWADMILFCNFQSVIVNVDGKGQAGGKNKARGSRRVMYTNHHACWDAKNRFSLPDELNMDFSEIAHVIISTKNNNNVTKPKTLTETMVMSEAVVKETSAGSDNSKNSESTEEFKPEETVSPYLSDEQKIPNKLMDLMKRDGVSEWDIQEAVASKGYYPEGTKIQDMSSDFINGVLIGAWDQVKTLAKQIQSKQEIPFE